MATIEKLICNLKDEVSKWFYQKGEVDGKLDEKAGTSVASSSGNGLMSSTDKVKLDGIAAGANKITVDSSLSSSSVNPVQNKVINTALSGKANSSHSHSAVTTSVNGFMSSADKTKLNGIATGANKTTVDTALSSTSTNPVQNKVVKAQLDSLNSTKANTNHTHGVAKQTSTIADNTFLTQLGNLAIFSWWTGDINIPSANTWTDVWTLPVTNKGKTVWSNNIYHGNGSCWLRVAENSNKVQAFSTKTGSIPIHSGELIFFIE